MTYIKKVGEDTLIPQMLFGIWNWDIVANHHNMKKLDLVMAIGIDANWDVPYEMYLEWYLRNRTPLGEALK